MIVFGTQDAGPAEYFSQIIKNINQPYKCFSSDISKRIFSKYLIKSYKLNFDLILKEKLRFIIVGSPPNINNLDYELLRWGRKNKIFTILVIEHWTNLNERLNFIDKKDFPNQLWVNDCYTKRNLLKFKINKQLIKIVGNPVLEKKKKIIKNIPLNFERIIFISEEMNSKEINLKFKYGFDEFEVLKKILSEKNSNTSLYIKLHPSENKNKYQSFEKIYDFELLEELEILKTKQNNLIIGMNSILLIDLALKGYFVYTYRPNGKEQFIGSMLNLTYDLNSSQLSSILKTNKLFKFKKRDVSFEGSLKRIKKIIEN